MTPRRLPTPQEIQAWINDIRPDPYFEQFVDLPGLLVLRAKGPRCEYRGLHIALSDRRRERFAADLKRLRSKGSSCIRYRASHPDGRAWFNLYTSGIDFGNWSHVSIELDHAAPTDGGSMGFEPPSTVRIRLSQPAVTNLISSLAARPIDGLTPDLPIYRDEKPSAEPHFLWLWNWADHAVDS